MTPREAWAKRFQAAFTEWLKTNPKPLGSARRPTPELMKWARRQNTWERGWHKADPAPELTPEEKAAQKRLFAFHDKLTGGLR